MNMTRQHFVALAAAMSHDRPTHSSHVQRQLQWESDLSTIANVCASSSGNFDRDKFLTAARDPDYWKGRL